MIPLFSDGFVACTYFSRIFRFSPISHESSNPRSRNRSRKQVCSRFLSPTTFLYYFFPPFSSIIILEHRSRYERIWKKSLFENWPKKEEETLLQFSHNFFARLILLSAEKKSVFVNFLRARNISIEISYLENLPFTTNLLFQVTRKRKAFFCTVRGEKRDNIEIMSNLSARQEGRKKRERRARCWKRNYNATSGGGGGYQFRWMDSHAGCGRAHGKGKQYPRNRFLLVLDPPRCQASRDSDRPSRGRSKGRRHFHSLSLPLPAGWPISDVTVVSAIVIRNYRIQFVRQKGSQRVAKVGGNEREWEWEWERERE